MAPVHPTSARVALLGATIAASSHADLILVMSDEFEMCQPTSIARRFGKTEALLECVLEAMPSRVTIDPPFKHDYPMLIRWHRGPIVRQLKSKDRPAVVRRHNNTNDRRINKRKTYLRSL